MRRPSWVDWALNVAATEHADVVARFAEAAALMRHAQRGAVTGRGGADVRRAMVGLRDRTGELARHVNGVLTGHGRPAALPEITERLAEIAMSDASTDRLRAGLVTGDADADSNLVFGDVGAPDAPAKPRAAARRRTKPPTPEPGPDLTLERRRIERNLETADRVSQAARRDAGRADTAVRHAQTAVDVATDAVNQAQASLDRAQRRLERACAEREAAHAKAEAAGDDVARLRAALDGVG